MKKSILTILILFAAAGAGFSQSLTEKRHIKTTALQVYENYKVVLSSLYSKDVYAEDNFMALFGDDAVIYNDIIPANTPARLSPAKYFKQFRANIKRVYPEFSNFKIGEPVSAGGKWQISCSFTRAARFRTIPDMKYPPWSFDYTMTIEMDKRYDTAKKVYENAAITNVAVDKPLEKYFVIENRDNIPLVAKSGKLLTGWDEEYQSRIFPENEWKIQDIGVSESGDNSTVFEYAKSRFSRNKTDTHFYQLAVQRFPKNLFSIGVSLAPVVGKTLPKNLRETAAENRIDEKNTAFSLSALYGLNLFHKDKTTLFLNLGLEMDYYGFNYNGKYRQELSDPTDEDNDAHLRKIKIDSLNEKFTQVSFSVPVSLQAYYKLSSATSTNPYFLTFELGGSIGFSPIMKSKYRFNADYTGLYNYFDGVEFDHYYDYGHFKNVTGSQNTTGFTGAGFVKIGLAYALNKSNLLKLDVSYKCVFESNGSSDLENYVMSIDKDSYNSLHQLSSGWNSMGIGLSWVKTIGGKK